MRVNEYTDLRMFISPLQWTVSGPAGPRGLRAQKAVVRDNRAPTEPSCSPACMEGPHVRAPTAAQPPALPLTVVSEGRKGSRCFIYHYSE